MFEAAPINTDKNLELLPSESVFLFEIVPRSDYKIPNPQGMMDPKVIRIVSDTKTFTKPSCN
jgi:hypothetical protein